MQKQMKTISDYTIYCTEEQTKKARELGAPIEIKTIEEAPKDWQGKAYFTGMATCAKLPTTEQMIGWLEDVFFNEIHIEQDVNGFWNYTIYWKGDINLFGLSMEYNSRKEATLAAIDAALEYLENLKH